MSRGLDVLIAAEIQKGTIRPVLLYEGEFATGTAYLWSGLGPLVWNGHTWTGVGVLGGVSSVEETAEVKAAGVTVSLSGIDSDTLSAALNAARQGAPGKIYLAFLDSAGALVGQPYPAFSGRLDVPTIDEGGETSAISFTYESRLADLERPRERRFTPDDQRIDYPDDKGLDYVPGLQDKTFTWGTGR